tara:strand:+ start:323 stop:673 length:351 start_codon:yes stop_codon:yes gene_type:complete
VDRTTNKGKTMNQLEALYECTYFYLRQTGIYSDFNMGLTVEEKNFDALSPTSAKHKIAHATLRNDAVADDTLAANRCRNVLIMYNRETEQESIWVKQYFESTRSNQWKWVLISPIA